MSALAVATFFAIGVAAWVYSRMSHRSNDNRSSLIIALVVALLAFFVLFTVLKFLVGM